MRRFRHYLPCLWELIVDLWFGTLWRSCHCTDIPVAIPRAISCNYKLRLNVMCPMGFIICCLFNPKPSQSTTSLNYCVTERNVPADGLATWYARTSAGIVMTYRSSVLTRPWRVNSSFRREQQLRNSPRADFPFLTDEWSRRHTGHILF